MVTIFRVEHPNGNIGPWSVVSDHYGVSREIPGYGFVGGPAAWCDGWDRAACWPSHDPSNLPGPGSDGIGDGQAENGFFGCESLELLWEWFSPEFRRFLRRWGFMLAQYEVDTAVRGGHQTVFRMDDVINRKFIPWFGLTHSES